MLHFVSTFLSLSLFLFLSLSLSLSLSPEFHIYCGLIGTALTCIFFIFFPPFNWFDKKSLCSTLYQRSYRILVTHDIRGTDLYKPIGFFLNPFLHCIVIVYAYMHVEFI